MIKLEIADELYIERSTTDHPHVTRVTQTSQASGALALADLNGGM